MTATVHPLPPISIYLEKQPSLQEQLIEKFNDVSFKTCRFCEIHRVMFSVIVMCLCIGGIIVSAILKNISIGPCYYYTSETLASDVSKECIMYLWNVAQCSTALESSPTWKWWIQSPQGLTMVKCDAVNKGAMCGAGSYNIIRSYIQICNSRFGQ